MRRVLILAVTMSLLPLAAWGQVTEDPAEKQLRIDKFQDLRLIYELDKDKVRTLRQGPDPIYDVDFVELMADPSLTKDWERERNKDFAFWLGSGVVGVPVGSFIFLQNFRGGGPLAFFGDPAKNEVSNASDLRAYTLSVLGGAVAIYGAYNLSLWAMELLDLRHPTRLEPESVEPRVRDWNDQLRDRLNLDAVDIPSPPPPRPSPSPSPSGSPGANEPLLPPAPVGGPGAMPYEGPPLTVPLPLPPIVPGAIPSSVYPTPRVRPSIFHFPRSVLPTPSPEMSAPPSMPPEPSPAAVSPSPLGSPSPKAPAKSPLPSPKPS